MALPPIAAIVAAVRAARLAQAAARTTGGIKGAGTVGKGAKNVTPVYRNTSKSNVKIVPNIAKEAKEFSKFQGQPMSAKQYQQIQNKSVTASKKFIKSGSDAKLRAKMRESENSLKPKKPTIKINSNK